MNLARQEHDRRLAVVINGNARGVNRDVLSLLANALPQGGFFLSHKVEDSEPIVRRILDGAYDTVLTAGGDGTFMNIVSHVYRSAAQTFPEGMRLGVLRLGTGNAIADTLGSSGGTNGMLGDIVRARTDAGVRPMRLVRVEGQLTPFAGLGWDALVLNDFARLRGALGATPARRLSGGGPGYFLAVTCLSLPRAILGSVPNSVFTNLGEPAYRMGSDGRPEGEPIPRGQVLYRGPVRVAGVATIPYYGFHFRMFPFAEDRPDRMQLRVSNLSAAEAVWNMRSLWHGQHRSPLIQDFLCDRIRVELDRPTPFQIGGDGLGVREDVTFELAPDPAPVIDFHTPAGVQ